MRHDFPHRPLSAPDFLLSRSTGSVRTQGSRGAFNDLDKAIAELKKGDIPMLVGALPFNMDKPVALQVPDSIIYDPGPLEPHSYYRVGEGSSLQAHLSGAHPKPADHKRRIEAAVETIARTPLEKVVLARQVFITFDPPVDPLLVAARLVDASNHRDGFVADLSPAGPEWKDVTLVGASPEVLIKKQGATVTAIPLAGSAPRLTDRDRDALAGDRLRTSTKDLSEHAFVVEHLRTILEPFTTDLSVPHHPQLVKTNELWHLASPITGTLRDPHISALELAVAVHPTPAVAGTPTHLAEGIINSSENRGFYGGAVGWSDNKGNGEYVVAIRCAEVSGDGRKARAFAGGGITAQSNPQQEVEETTTKLSTVLKALGLDGACSSSPE